MWASAGCPSDHRGDGEEDGDGEGDKDVLGRGCGTTIRSEWAGIHDMGVVSKEDGRVMLGLATVRCVRLVGDRILRSIIGLFIDCRVSHLGTAPPRRCFPMHAWFEEWGRFLHERLVLDSVVRR